MTEHDLTRDERLGAAIAKLPVPAEREEFWDELRATLAEPVPEQKPTKPQRSRRERALVVGLAAVGLILGGLITYNYSLPSSSSPSCAAIVVWHHHSYYGNDEHIKVHFGRLLGTGSFPPCGDTPGGPVSNPVTVKVYAIPGVSPSRAVAVEGLPTIEWIRSRR